MRGEVLALLKSEKLSNELKLGARAQVFFMKPSIKRQSMVQGIPFIWDTGSVGQQCPFLADK